MSSRLLASFLKSRGLMISNSCRYRPRTITRTIAPRDTSHGRVRHLSLEPDSRAESSDVTLSISGTIVAELQKANVRCTKIGIQELEEIYAEKTYSEVLGCGCSYDLWEPITTAFNPNTLSYLDSSASGNPQWRSEYAHDCWISHKVYKLREALYRHSTIFKNMIDHEEEDFNDFYLRPCCMASTHFWWWLENMIKHGLVEREDVDALPEVMFRDIVVGSGRAREAKEEQDVEG